MHSWGILALHRASREPCNGKSFALSCHASACASLRRILKITTTRKQGSWVILGHASLADLPRRSRGLLKNLVVRNCLSNHELHPVSLLTSYVSHPTSSLPRLTSHVFPFSFVKRVLASLGSTRSGSAFFQSARNFPYCAIAFSFNPLFSYNFASS
jgi:hypothetical protein